MPETWEVLSNIGARLMGLNGVPAKAVDDFICAASAEGAIEGQCPWPG